MVTTISLAGCKVRPEPVDVPTLEWEYTIKSAGADTSIKSTSLPVVTLVADGASLGFVIRQIAKQAQICVIYPEAFDDLKYSGNINGPADAILDAIARRNDLRFSLSNGVGYIGKPLPEDRAVIAFRSWLPDPTDFIQPLLSDGGKVTSSGGWVFVADRAEVIYRLTSTIADSKPRIYAVQVLEIFTSDSYDYSSSAGNYLAQGRLEYSPEVGFAALIKASASNSGAFIGRSWTGLVTEGKTFKFLQGSAERRTESVFQSSTPVIQNESFVTTGWHFEIQINAGSSSGEVYQDATDSQQYRLPFATANPGLFLINSAQLTSIDKSVGLPSSYARQSKLRRNLWLRYHLVGDLINKPLKS